MGKQNDTGVFTMTPEQKFKRKAKQVLKEYVPNITTDKMNGIVDDSWNWFEEHEHEGNMSEEVWIEILKKNGVGD
jgi:hypothetical protein